MLYFVARCKKIFPLVIIAEKIASQKINRPLFSAPFLAYRKLPYPSGFSNPPPPVYGSSLVQEIMI